MHTIACHRCRRAFYAIIEMSHEAADFAKASSATMTNALAEEETVQILDAVSTRDQLIMNDGW